MLPLAHLSQSDQCSVPQSQTCSYTTHGGFKLDNMSSDPLCECAVLLLLQVLADFPHTTAELKVDYLLDLFPEIQPRSFSIASSLKVTHP